MGGSTSHPGNASPENKGRHMRKIVPSALGALFLFGPALTAQAALVLGYTFDGNAADVSDNGLHGTIAGSPAFVDGQAGPSDKAILFNNPVGYRAATQWVRVPYASQLRALESASFTYAIKYRTTDAAQTNGRLFGNWTYTATASVVHDYNVGVDPRALDSAEGTSGTVAGWTTTVTDGNWHWIATVVDQARGEYRQYVDKTFAQITPMNIGTTSFDNLYIGRCLDPYYGARLTAVDEFRIYDIPFNSDDLALLDAPIPEPTTLSLLALGGLALIRRRRN